jgi:hypothetical protein
MSLALSLAHRYRVSVVCPYRLTAADWTDRVVTVRSDKCGSSKCLIEEYSVED